MKKIILMAAGLVFTCLGVNAQISLNATGGSLTGSYTTLNAAFAAINAGTHTGVITINLTGNTTEPATPTALAASGQGAASYSSVYIRPTVTATISGAPATARGVIELDGADNVTIDGDIAGGSVTRDLTIINSNANTIANTAAIRLIGRTTLGLGATNNTIKNNIIYGSTPGSNGSSGSTITSSFGIYLGGATLSTSGTGADNDNVAIQNNDIRRAYIAIYNFGVSPNLSDNFVVSQNSIGGNTTSEMIGLGGMNLSAIATSTIEQNQIFNIKVNTSVNNYGIQAAGSTNAVFISRNNITGIWSTSTGGYGAYGVNLTAGTNYTVINNTISDIRTENYSSSTTTYAAFGLRFAGLTGTKVYYNSVNLTGSYSSTSWTEAGSAAMVITSTAFTGDIRNNIFSNTMTSSAATRSFEAIWMPSFTNYASVTINNNAYMVPAGASYMVARASSPYATLSGWQAVSQNGNTSNDNASTPASNAGGAPFISATNLNIPSNTNTTIESGGVLISSLGTNIDFTGATRPVAGTNPNTSPDMGAYEFDGIVPICSGTPASANVVAASSIVCPNTSVALSLSTTYTALGMAYQWSASTSSVGPFTAITNGTNSVYTATVTANTWYQAVITCTNGNASTTATPVQVVLQSAPVYASVPFLEAFDNTWQNRCDVRNVPVANNWSSSPTTGNNSWRRQNDGASANWTSSTTSTVAPIGAGCADFHSYYAPGNSTGDLDVYLDMSATGNYNLSFYNYNASGSDSLLVYLSTNGGSGFTKVGGYNLATSWTKQNINLGSVGSPSCVVRLRGKSDFGASDIGVDSVSVKIVTCVTPPFAGVISGPNNVTIGTTNNYTITPTTGNLQWYKSSNINGPYTAISGATSSTANIVASPTGTLYYTVIASSVGCPNDTANVPYPVTVNPMTGDMVCSAQSLPIGPSSTYYNLFNYTTEAGEVAPPGTSCSANNAWCNSTLNNTRWFTFTAPASGNVSVQSPGFDTQLAVWSAATCSALVSPTNAILIAANDDDAAYTSHGGSIFSSYVQALCLIPGTTYYIQLDSYSSASSTDSTKVLITDLGANSFTGPASSYCLPSTASASLIPNIPGGAFTVVNTGTTTITAFTPSVVGAGTHTVYYNVYGCVSSSVVVVNAQPTVTAVNSGSAICTGNTMTVTAGGASTYTWNTGSSATSIAVSPTVNTTYTVTGTTTAGCTNSAVATVSVNSLPAVNIAGTNAVCPNGVATLTASGAATYTWNTGATTANISPSLSVATTYTVNATDANGCVNSAMQTVSVNPLPTVAVTGPSATCIGSSIQLTASGANTYSWSTGSSIATASDSPIVNTTYSVTGTSSVTGCSNTATQSVIVNSLPIVAVSGTSVMCAGTTATLTASGASTYTWNTNANTASITDSPTVTTSYSVTGTDGNGCLNSAAQTLTVNALPVVTITGSTTICEGTTASLSGNGANTYSWSTGSTGTTIAVSPSVTSSYTLVGVDANNCSNSAVQSVTVNPTPTITVGGGVICAGDSFTLNPSGANTYTFSTGPIVTPSVQTSYSVTGTDNSGCTSATPAIATVSVNALPQVSVTAANAICAGQTATLTAGGASTYTWNTNANTASITDNPTSTTSYTVNGTDANGCSNSAVKTITVNSLPVVTITGTNAVCDGISANLSGNGANTYLWSTGSGSVSVIVTPSVTSSYTVMGTDNNNCTNTASFMVTVNPNPTVTVAGGAICPGGSFTLAPSGATTYTYLPNGPVVSPGSTTTYSISGTDALGCISQTAAAAVVTVTNNLSVTVSGNAVICAGQSTSLTAGGAATYSWTTGASTSTITLTPTVNTTYSVTGSSGSCNNTAVITITVNALPSVSLAASSSTLCDNGQTVTLTGSPAGGVYSGSNVSGNMFTSTTAGTFIPVYSFTNSTTGCSNAANTTLVVSICTDITKVSKGLTGLQVYPNPNLGEFTIELNNGTEKNIEVTDLTGRIILSTVTDKSTLNVNISNLANGIYFVKVQSNNSVEVIKVVKQ